VRVSALLILLRDRPGAPPPPESLPLGRAALTLESEGIAVVLGGRVEDGVGIGLRARPGGWVDAQLPVDCAHDRFPGWTWPEAWTAAHAGLAGRPVGNPRWLTELCRDKLACQRALEAAGIPCPTVEASPTRFAERLQEWGSGFLKPRHGSLGQGVSWVRPGDGTPARSDAADDNNLLQRAILRDDPLALRVVVQRDADGWIALPIVARRSDDPVVNVERGATACLAREVVDPPTLAACEELAHEAAAALLAVGDGTHAVEMGLDLVLDRTGRPWVIEVNPVPRGRLRVLAAGDAGIAAAHEAACLRPLRAMLNG
jgi:glutathione synthase/RimK-type ligase-like ATP-grasp enzyme